MTGRDEVTLEDALKIEEETNAYVNKKSIWQKVWGFFTFVNIIWMLAVLGVTISVGPCLYQVFGPCLTRFFKKLGRVVKKVITWIFKKIVIPLVTFLHNWGFIELVIYMLTF